MKRRLPKYLIDLAKADLKEDIVSRIIENANDRGCWHLKSVNGKGIVDAVCHFRDKGTKKIFFKARRLVFKLIKGNLPEGLAVYSNCSNKYCVNPNHQYTATSGEYLKKLEDIGKHNRRSGFKHSAKTIIKMSKSHKGKKPDKITRFKMRLAKLGKKRDPEIVARTAEKYFRGEKNANAKLIEKQVLKIRSLKDKISSHELAKHYPVTASHLRSIWRKSCWKHL